MAIVSNVEYLMNLHAVSQKILMETNRKLKASEERCEELRKENISLHEDKRML